MCEGKQLLLTSVLIGWGGGGFRGWTWHRYKFLILPIFFNAKQSKKFSIQKVLLYKLIRFKILHCCRCKQMTTLDQNTLFPPSLRIIVWATIYHMYHQQNLSCKKTVNTASFCVFLVYLYSVFFTKVHWYIFLNIILQFLVLV